MRTPQHRVAEQRVGQRPALLDRQRPQGAQRRQPDQRVGIGHAAPGRRHRLAAGIAWPDPRRRWRARSTAPWRWWRACSSRAAASGLPALAASNVSVQVWKPLRLGPNQPSTAAAAQAALLVGVAVGAGVRGAEAHRLVGPRHPEGVVVAGIDLHVGLDRHVAGDALRAGRSLGMVVVRGGGELPAVVALLADGVAVGHLLQRVRVVAVAARDAGHEHLALAERRVVVDLVQALAVGLEQAGVQQARQVGVEQRLPRPPRLGDLGAARVAHPAGLELLGRRSAACCDGRCRWRGRSSRRRPGARRSGR